LIAASSSGLGLRCPTLSFGISLFLSLVGLAQADDANGITAAAADHHVQAVANVARGLESRFGVLLARVLTNHGSFPFKAVSISQRQAVLVEVAFVFGRVECAVHLDYCIDIKAMLPSWPEALQLKFRNDRHHPPQTDPAPSAPDQGPVVRERRKSQSLRIDDAAGLLGVSVDLMSRLENGQGSSSTKDATTAGA